MNVDHQHIYPDDLAPPKVVDVLGRKEESDGKHNKLRIAQKALVKSLVQCRNSQSQQKIGVEILEASVADLNRFKLRKKIQVGNFKYDPGKYYSPTNVRANDEGDEEIEEVDQAEILLDTAAFEDEIEAPWNQYAWIEELRLRVRTLTDFFFKTGVPTHIFLLYTDKWTSAFWCTDGEIVSVSESRIWKCI